MDVRPLGEGLVRVTLTGRLDAPGVDRIETHFLSSLVSGGRNAIVDLSQVDFVASMGLRMLMSAARSLRTRQAKLALYGAQERVYRVFEAVSLRQIIPICSTEEQALTAVASSLD